MRSSVSTGSHCGFHFDSLMQLASTLGAKKLIKRLFIANNGLAAVKGIDSIRSWLYEHIGDPDAIQFVVMATPEDLKANAEFIPMADQHVQVPGGPNSNNYANVDLIMHTAMQNTCDAIYPGWGHASENPALPRECDKSKQLTFLGPTEAAMFALGDKIASTIVAQSNGVPTVPWSGDGIFLPPGTFDVDPATYEKAYVTSPEECEAVCRRVGFPVMIKASEGGGGKGIRRCNSLSEVKDMYFAVSEEVKGSHIFVMRMLENVRHLEVQLLADMYGNCIAVRTRDCSVQRRHQKIIEEGPVFGVDRKIIDAMEAAAIQMARAVSYRGVGTVEYMYDKTTHEFFFLELNPRLQVEHPVSELISGVNLPAALLCVGMGIPLHQIPEVRVFYGEQPYENTPIDFTSRQSHLPKCHTIAVRITAEDTDEGFRPSSGHIEEISFRNSKECWGYFSVGSGGEIHQFADSQFGHIFSSGDTREEARRGMVLALRNLVIRGEIRTSTSYVLELLETPAFRDCDVSTAWLDRLIAQRAAEAPTQESVHVALIAAGIFRNIRVFHEDHERYTAFLAAGHVPSTEYLSNCQTESYVTHSKKYTIKVGRVSPTEFAIALNGSIVVVPFRILKSGAIQLTLAAKTLVAYAEKEPNSLRVTVGGKTTTFTGDLDPTKILASVPGRLVRYVIDHDGHVNEGSTFAEVEVMKMILPLRASCTGVLHHRAVPGSTITVGALLAEVVPDDPSKVARPQEIRDPWPEELLLYSKYERPDGATRARRATETLWNMLYGYHFTEVSIEERVRGALDNLTSLFMSSVTLQSLQLPFLPVAGSEVQTPNEKLRVIFSTILNCYVEMEKVFDNRSRQEAIEALREKSESSDEVFTIDFAHNQECHHELIKAILSFLEHNDVLLKSLHSTLSKLVELHSYTYGSLLLQVRYLLRQCSLPSFTERKTQFATALEVGSLRSLLEGGYGYDLMCSVMFDRQMSNLIQGCLELFIRREYFGESVVRGLDIFKSGSAWFSIYSFEPVEGAEMITNPCESTDVVRPECSGAGVCIVFRDEQQLRTNFESAFLKVLAHCAQETTIATIFFAVTPESAQEAVATTCARLLDENKPAMAHFHHLDMIVFVVHGMPAGPHIFTFRRDMGFCEDTLIRNVLPQSARRLELDRLSNFDVTMYPTPFKEVHVFKATPRRQGASILENRMFARVVVTPHDMGMTPWTEGTEVDTGHMLAKCTAALEVAHDDTSIKYPSNNHIFVKLIELTFDVSTMRHMLKAVAVSFQQKLAALGVSEVEVAFQAKVPSGFIPMRVMANSYSGYGVSIKLYYESVEDGVLYLHRAENAEDVSVASPSLNNEHFSSEQLLEADVRSPTSPRNYLDQRVVAKLEALRQLLPSKKERLMTQFPSALGEEEAKELRVPDQGIPLAAYPLVSAVQVKRLQARAAKTTYVHDWPGLVSLLVRKDWAKLCHARKLNPRDLPSSLFSAVELFYHSSDRTLRRSKEGSAPCGMVAWLVEYCPARYFSCDNHTCDARRFVMVANDITFQSGSFAVTEDVVFTAACELARSQHIPFVYVSANSGARLGLSVEVKKRFRVAFTEKNVIDYLYLTPEDFAELTEKKIAMEVEERVVGDERRYVITGVVGAPTEFIGVENLSGSGLIAGQMSKNYSMIPTISIVTGRSVGIGAYLNRLGRRVIQTGDSPLILTGAGALNRLLGKEVYINNSQLGGRQIMVPNGVTHWNTKHDFASARTLLNWLDFVPAVSHPTRCAPHPLTLPIMDPIDRPVTFTPEASTPYDPRLLVTGVGERSGLFDRGSWMETLEGWAKSVVTGRATLGGIPCGVILVETRLSKKFDPADPADPTSTSSFVSQAGQVWFPDSARKTADALDDFNHERLPCFILANWRGFSGGMRDMFDEVLKFGASIVDNLRTYTAPVFIYIPPFGELRGGAWVVVDPVINHNGVVEMYCDTTARGGILEPSGVVEIKFRDNDVRELIRRNNPQLAAMEPKKAREEENRMLPRYRDVAVRFADLHDTHTRMKATGVVRDVVPWQDSRRHFYHKLQRKLVELQLANDLLEAGHVADLASGVKAIEERYRTEFPSGVWGCNDIEQHEWLSKLQRSGSLLSGDTHEEPRVEELKKLFAAGEHESDSATTMFTKLFEGNKALAEAARAALQAATETQEGPK